MTLQTVIILIITLRRRLRAGVRVRPNLYHNTMLTLPDQVKSDEVLT